MNTYVSFWWLVSAYLPTVPSEGKEISRYIDYVANKIIKSMLVQGENYHRDNWMFKPVLGYSQMFVI